MDISEIIARAGGVTRLGEIAGVDYTTVIYWRTRGRIPVPRAITISNRLNIPRYEIRPDIWPAPEHAGD